jgi:uncharacterized protein YkwD
MTRVAIVLCAVLAAGLAISAPTSTAAGQLTQRDATLERALVSEMNAVRARHGLQPLTTATGLRAAAVAHTRSMAQTGLFQHESADGSPFHQRVLRYYATRGAGWSVGENLVFGSAPFGAKNAVRSWLRSPPHRRNLLNPAWREIGVGAVVAQRAPGAFGGGTVVIVTADFGRRR